MFSAAIKCSRQKNIQFTSLLCVNSFIHESPSCRLIVVTLFLQYLHKVTEALWRGRLSVNQTVLYCVGLLGSFYNQRLWKSRSTYREEYWTRHRSLITLKTELVKCKKEIMLKNRNQNVRILFFSFEKKVQDRRLNKCNLIFLLITLHTFIKTTIDYNLTICVKKGTATKLQTQIVAVFFC